MQLIFHPLAILVAHHANRMERQRIAEIREHRNELEEAQKISGIANWYVALDGGQHYMASQGERFVPLEELRRRGVDAIIELIDTSYQDELRAGIGELLAGDRETFELLEVPYQSSGEEGFLSLIVVAVGTPPTLLEGTLEDVTEHMRQSHEQDLLRDQVLEARRLETLGRMAGGIAHEFNNLLMTMGAATQMLGGKDDHGGLLREMKAATEGAHRLVQQLVAFAGKEGLAPAQLSPAKQIRELEPILQRLVGESVTLELLGMEVRCEVLFDATQLEQVLVNLCVNARDAMPDGGSLSLGLREHRGADAQSSVELWVQDSGMGMDQRTLTKAFEPFFTTKAAGKGTGLGLAMVDGIIRKNGGRLEVETAVGNGSTFRIFLPIAIDEIGERENDASIQLPLEQHYTLLFVDDETSVRKILTSFLRESGFVVHAADCDEQALTQFDLHEEDIDIVVSDVQMPGMLGHQLIELLRRKRPELPVLFMSGYADDIPQTDARTKFLSKPFPQQRLMQELAKLVELLPERGLSGEAPDIEQRGERGTPE